MIREQEIPGSWKRCSDGETNENERDNSPANSAILRRTVQTSINYFERKERERAFLDSLRVGNSRRELSQTNNSSILSWNAINATEVPTAIFYSDLSFSLFLSIVSRIES
ncbi:hypothetical protein WA026_007816 [Henosepilachna vigintioctopunctata]|uniref:Uncharacterized protein n=1 Tax=Henosepilachna vigintioctopunctata TaxID=420089 RepID=A0AAW1TYS3_9CUCU